MFANHIVPALGKKRIDQIGPKEIELYKARAVKAGLKGKTINNQLSALLKALTVAAEWGLIDQPPRVHRAKTAPPPFDYLSFDEATRLVEAADQDWRPMILTALGTRLRIGEWWRCAGSTSTCGRGASPSGSRPLRGWSTRPRTSGTARST